MCLQNYHPIFSKFALEAVKTFLEHSVVIQLKKGQRLFDLDFNTTQVYFILFGKLKLVDPEKGFQVGQTLCIGWTAGEEILFKKV